MEVEEKPERVIFFEKEVVKILHSEPEKYEEI